MPRLAVVAVLLLTATAQAQPPEPAAPAPEVQVRPAKPRPKEPAQQIVEDMRSFVSALSSDAHHFWAVNYVADARYGLFGANEWMRYWNDANTFDGGRYKLR